LWKIRFPYLLIFGKGGESMVYVITAIFIVLDMVTGIVKAFKEKNFASSIMREGLFHKCGSVLCVAFGVLVKYAQHYIDIGIIVPVSLPVCAYIIVMEIGSIIENVCTINPQIMPEKLKGFFSKLSK
jgi:polar amino acid transport system substrate-binding protein